MNKPTQKGFLVRTKYTDSCTLGVLIVGGCMFHTIEPPWRNNRRNVSCIPTGQYLCTYLPRSASGKYRKVYHIRNVNNRSGVLIHNGNLARHSRGCVILGLKKGRLGGLFAVLRSRMALTKLGKLLNNSNFILKVV